MPFSGLGRSKAEAPPINFLAVEEEELDRLQVEEAPKPPAPPEVDERSPLAKAIAVVALGAFYVGVSSSMIFFNKEILVEDKFPFPACLTMTHQVTAFTMASILKRINPKFFPAYEVVFPKQDSAKMAKKGCLESSFDLLRALTPFFALAFGFAVSLILGNYAYTVAPVSFLQMIKEAQIAFIYPLTVCLGMDKFQLKGFICIIFIAIFGGMAIGEAPAFSLPGLLVQGTSSFAGAMQQTISQRVMSRYGGAKIDPMTMVLCSAPCAFIWLILPNVTLWEDDIPDRFMANWRLLALNNCFAFGLQVTMAVAIRNLSAVGLACCSVIKDVLIVIVSGLVLGEPLGGLQIAGFTGATISISIYSAMKLYPEKFECGGRGSEPEQTASS
mmetsp:Transcript_21312/g.38961  ORF Transcript_21312/g.38961 Transcript_21312/m.38961 type:complete len:386 (+) Transcript_21312:63-1220(+)